MVRKYWIMKQMNEMTEWQRARRKRLSIGLMKEKRGEES